MSKTLRARVASFVVATVMSLAVVALSAPSAHATAPVDGAVFASLGSGANPVAALADRAGALFTLNEGDGTLSKITPFGVVTRTFASLGAACRPQAMTRDPKGYLFVACGGTDSVTRVSPDGTVIRFWAYDGVGAMPRGITSDASGTVYVSNWGTSTISRITPAGAVQPVFARLAPGDLPLGMSTDARGNLFVAETHSDRISKVTPTGVVDETFAALPALSQPVSLAVDPWGVVSAGLAAGALMRIAADGSIVAPSILLTTGPHRPTTVLGDAYGDVFVGDELSGSVAAVDVTGARVESLARFGAHAVIRAVAFTTGAVFAAEYASGEIRRTELAPSNIPLAVPGALRLGDPVSLSLGSTGVFAEAIVSVGDLPPGLVLDADAGTISGTPTAEGSYEFDVVVANRWGVTAPRHELVDVAR